ncbi:MAG TPA: lactoylglutathione lyase [Gammaproteobacteria bacterium]|nr:lactoylglutathione lyase [Gammaproteobacteria bacterium]
MNNARLLHTMLRVGNMQRSIEYYTRVLGMKVLRTLNQPSENYSLTFLGYGDESDTCVLELTYNHGISSYDMGNAFGHIAIGVHNCQEACTLVRKRGGKIVYGPEPLKGSDEIIAFTEDPDGYQVELVQRPGM